MASAWLYTTAPTHFFQGNSAKIVQTDNGCIFQSVMIMAGYHLCTGPQAMLSGVS